MKEHTFTSISELRSLCEELLIQWQQRRKTLVVGFNGDLGAGKTTMIQQIAALLQVSEKVTSPTYMLLHKFDAQHDYWKKLLHIDLYRLGDNPDISVLRLEEYINEPANLICIEWAELLKDQDFFDVVIHLETTEKGRVLTIKG